MTWNLSHFRAGDLVEIRSKEEILATLDEQGCVDGMPFMPEMLQYCGRRFRVGAVAHKTCDTLFMRGGRRLQSTVHLAGLRCGGSAHGGCQAECNLFWKDVWLKPVARESAGRDEAAPGGALGAVPGGCTEAQLLANTRAPVPGPGEEPRYRCQATELLGATKPLPWWDFRQYFYDVVTGNHPARRVARVLWLASLRALLRVVPVGYRAVKAIHDLTHRLLTGRAAPDISGKVGPGTPTPTGRLDLKPGELVRIKSKEAIEETLNQTGKNRGLLFDAEMAPYCGKVFRVRKSVSTIIDERTGKMVTMKQPCIMLEGVVCQAEYIPCRLNCPRAIPSYWREIWLERVDVAANAVNQPQQACSAVLA